MRLDDGQHLNSVSRCFQKIKGAFKNLIFWCNYRTPEVEDNGKDVEKGLNQPKEEETQDETDDEEGCMDKLLPDCIRQSLPRLLLVLLVAWGLASDTLLAIWDVSSDYFLAAKHYK